MDEIKRIIEENNRVIEALQNLKEKVCRDETDMHPREKYSSFMESENDDHINSISDS